VAPAALAERYTQYGPLKADTAAAVVEALAPVQARYADLVADESSLRAVLADGAAKATTIATPVMARARAAVGLLPH
jgi:tryptophanyl-tRNA synthetase